MFRTPYRILTVVLALSVAGPAGAASLQALIGGEDITVGNATFDQWELLFVDASGPRPDLSAIDVVPLDGDPLRPGLKFVAPGTLATTGPSFIDLEFGFVVTATDASQPIIGAALDMTGGFAFGSDGGLVVIVEDVFNDTVDRTLLAEADQGRGQVSPSASTGFGPQASLSVQKFITLEGDGPQDTVALEEFNQRFVLVPEPASAAIAAVAALGAARRAGPRVRGGRPMGCRRRPSSISEYLTVF